MVRLSPTPFRSIGSWVEQGCMFCRAKTAWQEEFWPTTAAEFVVHLLWMLCKRALWLYDPDLRQAYISAVPKVSQPNLEG